MPPCSVCRLVYHYIIDSANTVSHQRLTLVELTSFQTSVKIQTNLPNSSLFETNYATTALLKPGYKPVVLHSNKQISYLLCKNIDMVPSYILSKTD